MENHTTHEHSDQLEESDQHKHQPLPELKARQSGHEHHQHDHHEHTGQHAPAMKTSAAQAVHSDHDSGEHAGHGAHTDHTGHEQLFRRKFWISLLLSIPVLLFDPMVQSWLGFRIPIFPGSAWITPVFSIIIFFYGGLPFLEMAVPEIKNKQPGMMTLISLAITVAFVYSLAALFIPAGAGFFWELVTLIDIMLLGHWIEMRSIRQASGALNELARLMPDSANRILPDGREEKVAVSALSGDDLVLVRPGESIPADGIVETGESDANEAMLTGESTPAKKQAGDKVIAGTINGDGSLRVKITAVGEATALAGIMRLVDQAQKSKSRTQVLADRAAGWLFYISIAVAVLTAIAWTLAQGFNTEVIARVATVLVIACPHALGLAVPLVVAITTALGAKNGILVRDRLALEKAREIDMIVFDKTGTLTEGEFGVVGIATSGMEVDQALALTAALEGDSEHTIARGIRKTAENRNLVLPEVTSFEALKGRGVRAKLGNKVYYIGGPRLLEALTIQLPEALAKFEQQSNEHGQTVVTLIEEDGDHKQALASIALADVIRPASRRAIQKLHEMGIQVAMLTGDSEAVAQDVSGSLGIDTYFAQVLPQDKEKKIAELKRQGKTVAMVGDGVNDAPALATADVGIAIGSGTDVAIESAGIILVKSDPLDVVKIFDLSQASYRKMTQNLIWAAAYNVIALPLAAGVLAPWGILLSPAVGAVLMSLSTIIVAINAQTLRWYKLAA